jgi:hypothetical protein
MGETADHGRTHAPEISMQYMMLLYVNEAGWPQLTPAQQAAGTAAYTAYTEALQAAGALRANGRLQPVATATTVRETAGGKTEVLDGPYTETKEQLGGFYLIEAPDLDAALAWAKRCPAANHGVVEVRPLWTYPR